MDPPSQLHNLATAKAGASERLWPRTSWLKDLRLVEPPRYRNSFHFRERKSLRVELG